LTVDIDQGGFGPSVEIDEADRQAIVLALALTALLRPGWDSYLESVATKLWGATEFAEFKRANADQVRPTA
jgi:hypothetical protein